MDAAGAVLDREELVLDEQAVAGDFSAPFAAEFLLPGHATPTAGDGTLSVVVGGAVQIAHVEALRQDGQASALTQAQVAVSAEPAPPSVAFSVGATAVTRVLPGDELTIHVRDANGDRTPGVDTIAVRVTSAPPLSDAEVVVLSERAPGEFTGVLPTRSARHALPGNGQLEVRGSDAPMPQVTLAYASLMTGAAGPRDARSGRPRPRRAGGQRRRRRSPDGPGARRRRAVRADR